jgi:hypothetical protein
MRLAWWEWVLGIVGIVYGAWLAFALVYLTLDAIFGWSKPVRRLPSDLDDAAGFMQMDESFPPDPRR